MKTIWEAIQKRSHEPILVQNSYKNLSKEIKSDKVGRAITKLGAIEKSQILRIILHFDSNIIFVD